jgi:hypothetical protein
MIPISVAYFASKTKASPVLHNPPPPSSERFHTCKCATPKSRMQKRQKAIHRQYDKKSSISSTIPSKAHSSNHKQAWLKEDSTETTPVALQEENPPQFAPSTNQEKKCLPLQRCKLHRKEGNTKLWTRGQIGNTCIRGRNLRKATTDLTTPSTIVCKFTLIQNKTQWHSGSANLVKA